MITKRAARTIRGAITDARKFAHFAARGYVLQSRNLKGLYGRAYLRAVWAYKPVAESGPPFSNGPLGFYQGRR
jgi:hypothetical protein